MTPAEFLDKCAARGVALTVTGDKLKASGPRQPATVSAYLRQHKADLVDLLTAYEELDRESVPPPRPTEAELIAEYGADLVATARQAEREGELIALAKAGRLPVLAEAVRFPAHITEGSAGHYHVTDFNAHVLGCLARWRYSEEQLATHPEDSPDLRAAWEWASAGEADNIARACGWWQAHRKKERRTP